MSRIYKDYSKFFYIAAVSLIIAAFFVANVEINPQMANISAIFIIALSLPCYIAMILWLGWKKGIITILVFSIYALVIETLAIITGFPYSPFQYTGLIGTKLFGYTPFTVPFAYVPLFLGCIYLAGRLTLFQEKNMDMVDGRSDLRPKILFILGTAALVLAADLVLDPAAVALNFWNYLWPGFFYGVPFMNFLGWILTGVLASGLALLVVGASLTRPKPPAVVSSLFLILCFWSAVCFYLGLIIPGVIGIIFIIYILKETGRRVGDFSKN
ncbi:MAG: carotenoid biosynthesis protein [Methanobacteriaceae archaeon]|nr:carotenoid biosynthesis protein [Methanobacteriaceae archaeon]